MLAQVGWVDVAPWSRDRPGMAAAAMLASNYGRVMVWRDDQRTCAAASVFFWDKKCGTCDDAVTNAVFVHFRCCRATCASCNLVHEQSLVSDIIS